MQEITFSSNAKPELLSYQNAQSMVVGGREGSFLFVTLINSFMEQEEAVVIKWYLMDQYSHLQDYLLYLNTEYEKKPSGSLRLEYNKIRAIEQYLEWLIYDVESKIED